MRSGFSSHLGFPWTLPSLDWLFDVEQFWGHEVNQELVIDARTFQDKLQYRRHLDAKIGHNKLTFAFVRGATPTLESDEQLIDQAAICVPVSQRIRFLFVWLLGRESLGVCLNLDPCPMLGSRSRRC